MKGKPTAVASLPTVHRENLADLLRRVADEIESEETPPTDVVIVTRSATRTLSGGTFIEGTDIGIWSAGPLGDTSTGLLGLLEHAKLRMAVQYETDPDG